MNRNYWFFWEKNHKIASPCPLCEVPYALFFLTVWVVWAVMMWLSTCDHWQPRQPVVHPSVGRGCGGHWPGLPFTTAHPFSWTRLRVKQEDKPSAVVTYSIAADIEKWRWRGDICSLPDHFCPWWHIVLCILLTFYLSSSWTVHSLEMRNLATWFNLIEVLATLGSKGGRSSIPTSAHTGGSFLCKTLSWNPDTLAKHIYRQHWRLQRGRKGPKM